VSAQQLFLSPVEPAVELELVKGAIADQLADAGLPLRNVAPAAN
jgi:hypothetical protein